MLNQDNNDIIRMEAVSELHMSRSECRKFNAHGIANDMAAQGIRVTLAAPTKMARELERELGDRLPSRRPAPPPPPRRPKPRLRREPPPHPAEPHPLLTIDEIERLGPDEQCFSEIRLTEWEHDQLVEQFSSEEYRDDYEGHPVDLVHSLWEDERAEFLCLGYQIDDDADTPVDPADFSIALTQMIADREGQKSAYAVDPDVNEPLKPFEAWFGRIGPGKIDGSPGYLSRCWPNIMFDFDATESGDNMAGLVEI